MQKQNLQFDEKGKANHKISWEEVLLHNFNNDLTLVLNSVPREKVLNIAQQALKDSGMLTVKHKVLAVKNFITVSFNTRKTLYKFVLR